jgi:hypothetical protein
MKKLTSKSVSAAPKTSSRCGTSVQTAVTAKQKKATRAVNRKASALLPPVGATGAFQLVAEKAKKMSPAEFRVSLVKAGIIGTNGKLTAQYAKSKTK